MSTELKTRRDIQWIDTFPRRREPDPVDRLDEILWRGERRWPRKKALFYRNRSWTYHELAERVRRIGSGLEKRGLQRGDRVVLLGESSPFWLMVYFGIVSIGATAVPLEPGRDDKGIQRALRLSDPSAGFIAEERAAESVWERRIDGPVVAMDGEGRFLDEVSAPIQTEFPRPDLPSTDHASVLFTSGTTGEAKGVCLSHANFAADLNALYEVGLFSSEDRFLSILPIFHSYEFTGGQMLPLYAGASIVYARDLTSNVLLDHFQNDGITILLGVPLVYQKLLDRFRQGIREQPAWKRWIVEKGQSLAEGDGPVGRIARERFMRSLMRSRGFRDLRLMISGGAPLDPEVPRTFRSLGLSMMQGYGMTELSPVVTVNPPDSPHPDSVGLALRGTRVGVRDPNEKGIGEIVVSGPTVFDQYLGEEDGGEKDPFPTGDMGRIEDGYLFVEGRKKFTIVTAEGKNVFPQNVEDVYRKSPFIGEVLVVGTPREDGSGVQLKAIVVPDEEEITEQTESTNPSQEELARLIGGELKRLGEELQPHQRVRDFELRFEPFPRTPTQKIKRYLFDQDVYEV